MSQCLELYWKFIWWEPKNPKPPKKQKNKVAQMAKSGPEWPKWPRVAQMAHLLENSETNFFLGRPVHQPAHAA